MGNCVNNSEGNCVNISEDNCVNNSTELPKIYTATLPLARHSYNGVYKYCTFNDIYDGDTADINFYDGDKIIKTPFRFFGYDSAEMKPLKSIINRESIIKNAHNDKHYLADLLVGPLVVKFMENEKYGRMMGEVWKVKSTKLKEEDLAKSDELIDDNCVNKLMIAGGHGVVYYGGRKNIV